MSVVAGTVAWLVTAVTPTPTPIDPSTTTLGSPGIAGFLVTFVVALAAIGLFLSLTRHLRIVDRRSRQRDELEAAEASDIAQGTGTQLPPGSDDPPGDA
jgi:hypothetical protein